MNEEKEIPGIFDPPTDCTHCHGLISGPLGTTYICEKDPLHCYPLICPDDCEDYEKEVSRE